MKRSPKHKRLDSTRKSNGKIKQKKRRLSYFGKMILLIACFIFVGILAVELLTLIPIMKSKKDNSFVMENPDHPAMENYDLPNYGEENYTVILDVEPLCQNPLLPTGCESCSAAMALNYIGVDTDMETVAMILPKQPVESKEEKLFGPDPEQFFAGSPFDTFHCFGCFENVIINAVNDYYGNIRAQKVYGSLEDFCVEFVDRGQPVIIWATMNMKAVSYTSHWTLPDGTEYYWPGGEHCMLLIGHDEFDYYLNDPLEGAMVAYPKELVEAAYEEMGSRAVVIYRNY